MSCEYHYHATRVMESRVKSCFSDLNVVSQDTKKANEQLLRKLADYGYEQIALSKEVTLAKKVQLKAADNLPDVVENIPSCKNGTQLRVLQRLTVQVEEPSLLHALSSPALDSYDLLAVRPKSDKVFQQACGVLNIDVISVDLTERLPFNFKHAQVGKALERGVHFEICYSPAIKDATARRNTLANAVELVKVTKGKNIIVSSEAEKVLDLRAPADVANLCHLFGISGGWCKATITMACRSVLLHAAMRQRTAKGVVSSVPLKETSGGEPSKESLPKAEQKRRKRKGAGKEDKLGSKKAKLSTTEQAN